MAPGAILSGLPLRSRWEARKGLFLISGGLTTPVSVLTDDGKPISNNAGKGHSCASLWIESGHNPKQIQKLMGHSSIKITFDVYRHLFADNEADQRAAEAVESRLGL